MLLSSTCVPRARAGTLARACGGARAGRGLEPLGTPGTNRRRTAAQRSEAGRCVPNQSRSHSSGFAAAMQRDGAVAHVDGVSEHNRCSTRRQEIALQIRRYLATAAGASALIVSGLGLALAGPASAATPPAPTPTTTTSPTRAATPKPPPSVAPSPARTESPAIEVPAGNAKVGKTGGATDLDLAALLAAGVVLAGAGTVVAVRRRA